LVVRVLPVQTGTQGGGHAGHAGVVGPLAIHGDHDEQGLHPIVRSEVAAPKIKAVPA